MSPRKVLALAVPVGRGEVRHCLGSKELSGTNKTSDMRTRLDRALVTDVHTAAVVKDERPVYMRYSQCKIHSIPPHDEVDSNR